MTYNTDRFLAAAEKAFGHLKDYQRQGFTEIISEFVKRKITDVRWLAYMLATAWHETACTMRPIAEYGKGKGRPYGVPKPPYGQTYYGRGYVQLTWDYNYSKAEKLIKERTGQDFPLYSKADTALDPEAASNVLFYGMIEGWFTGKKLDNYFSGDHEDPVGARRIINGTDKAATIAGYYRTFVNALRGAQEAEVTTPATVVPVGSATQAPEAPKAPVEAPKPVTAPPIEHPSSPLAPTLGEVLWGYMKSKINGR